VWAALMFAGCAGDSDAGVAADGAGGAGGSATEEDAGPPGPTCTPAFDPLSISIAVGPNLDYVGPGTAVIAAGQAPRIELPTGDSFALSPDSKGHSWSDGEAVRIAARLRNLNDGALSVARVAVRDAATGELRFAVYHDFIDDAASGGPWATALPDPEVFGFELAIEAHSTCFEPEGTCWSEGTETQRLRVTLRPGEGDGAPVTVEDGGSGRFFEGDAEYEVHVATARHWPPDRSVCTDGVESGGWLAFDVRPKRSTRPARALSPRRARPRGRGRG
jgi:hypothetical protein